MPRPIVKVSCKGNKMRVDPRTVKRRAGLALVCAGCSSSELSVLLCDNRVIRALNLKYRGVDAPTDVLSFSMGDENESGPDLQLMGDVVISVETAERQAKKAGISSIDEVTSLLIHGILHLVGHDHGTPGESKKMRAETLRIESMIRGRSRN